MAKQFKDKVAELKAIANGLKPVETLRPPQNHVVCRRLKRGVITYQIGAQTLSEQEYEQWYKENVREDLDKLILFVEVLHYEDENGDVKEREIDEELEREQFEQNNENRVVWNETLDEDEEPYSKSVLEIHQEPIQAQQETKEQIRQPIKEAQEEPVLRPLSEHIAFNEYMTKILTRSW